MCFIDGAFYIIHSHHSPRFELRCPLQLFLMLIDYVTNRAERNLHQIKLLNL
jgi:hypothetical protein